MKLTDPSLSRRAAAALCYLVLGGALVCAPFSVAFAQEAESDDVDAGNAEADSDAPSQEQPRRRVVEEITVTAERREATISDTSLSMSAFDSSFIQEFGLRNQEDLQNYTPAVTIQPYDITIRGVGRTSRTLGGDPGVATYFNGLYSEDFGIASTEGGLFDMERIEVLRGPQGTLYGRNAVGGAVNFISKRPTNDYEVELQSVFGDFNTIEHAAVLSGPLVEDILKGRFTYTRRRRDGYIDDTSPFGNSINDYGDENFALAAEFTPTERLTFYARANTRDFDRKFNGGAGTSPIVTSQDGLRERDTESLAFGWRQVDAGSAERTFTDPLTGEPIFGARIRPGVDPNAGLEADGTPGSLSGSSVIPNYAIGLPQDRAHMTRVRDANGRDLVVDTNGQYEELFDHQAGQFVVNYDHPGFNLEYRFGYTDFLYERNTDEDKTGNTVLGSYDFYVNQENENWQHEIQANFDIGERLFMTAGLFAYDSHIDQRLDLHDPIDTQCRFQCAADYATMSAPQFGALLEAFGIGVNEQLDIRSAQTAFDQGAPLDEEGTVAMIAPWFGDGSQALRQGPVTDGTFFAWDNTIETRAYAVYAQGEYQIDERWSFTAGLRWARDEKDGQERMLSYLETPGLAALTVFDPVELLVNDNVVPAEGVPIEAFLACGQSVLCMFNVTNGAIDPATLEPVGIGPDDPVVRFNDAPLAFASYMPLSESWNTLTWRLNLDFTPRPGQLIYLSATTGWKSGGFNLGFRSVNNPVFDEEEVLAIELGYKGRLLDGALQLNASTYVYLYDDIQTSITLQGEFGTGTNIVNAPEARTIGVETDFIYLVTEGLTLGGNASFTHAEFTDTLLAVDDISPTLPGSLLTPQQRMRDIDGNRLPNIPEWKLTLWGNHTWYLGDFGRLDLRSSLSWTDRFYLTVFNDSLDVAPDFFRWDARVSWRSPTGAWGVSGFVHNITDAVGVRQSEQQGELEGNFLRAITPTDPRVFGVQLNWNWVR